MKIEIKHRYTAAVLHSGEYTSTLEAVTAALKAGADLSGAYLSRAYLSRAYLSGANLSGANLSGANLSGANLSGVVDAWAQIAFKAHGECGRMLTAIKLPNCEPEFFCGCFTGSEAELRQYIIDGEARLAPSRTLAMDTLIMLLNQPKP